MPRVVSVARRVAAKVGCALLFAFSLAEAVGVEIPTNADELRQQIKRYENPQTNEKNACTSIERPFLLRYNETDGSPLCLSEEEVARRRLDPASCNTLATLGPEVSGGCSQFNFLKNPEGEPADDYSTVASNGDVRVVPMHRAVPHYHGNLRESPEFETVEYYDDTEYLPCYMHTDARTEDFDRTSDLDAPQQGGYCDVDAVVKDKLCWSGAGTSPHENTPSQGDLVGGVFFGKTQPCDVLQHLSSRATPYVTSSVNPSSYFLRSKFLTPELVDIAKEAEEQSCSKWRVKMLEELIFPNYERGDYATLSKTYTGWKGIVHPEIRGRGGTSASYDDAGNLNQNVDSENWLYPDYSFSTTDRRKWNKILCNIQSGCIDEEGSPCTTNIASCQASHAWEYGVATNNHCWHKDIERAWEEKNSWSRGKPSYYWDSQIYVTSRAYTDRATNWEAYYTATNEAQQRGQDTNACDGNMSTQQCAEECHKRCGDMKFPAFSVQNANNCKCSDYTKDRCPNWVEDNTHTSYSVFPGCKSNECNSKTYYPNNLRPCQFTEEYRKTKCLEACAKKGSLFMTVDSDGLCMCSKDKKRGDNTLLALEDSETCPWSTAARVYKDRIAESRFARKGYLGDSFVSISPLSTYQILYNSYYDSDMTPDEGVVVCEDGGAVKELLAWYKNTVGKSLKSNLAETEIRQLYKEKILSS